MDFLTPLVLFLWDFGDGKKVKGVVVDHCYSEPGKFSTILSLIQKETGAYFEEELKISVQI